MFGKGAGFVRDIWTLTKPYWRSEERWRAGGLLAAIIALHLGGVYLSVMFNEWNNLFYNSLQDKNFDNFVHQLMRFCGLAAIFIVTGAYRVYLRQMLQIRWRRWLTDRYLGEWLGDTAYYRLQLLGGRTDNPDQRISEDIGGFVQSTLVLCIGLLDQVVTLFSFAAILWGLSGGLTVAGLTVPGYMLWVAIVYSAIGTGLAHLVGRPLIRLNYQQQQFEADFRYSLVRLRENAEGIALYGGEEQEFRGFTHRFAKVVENWWGIMRQQKRLTLFTLGFSQIADVFPVVVAAPRYFSGAIQLGGLMQTASAFGHVQGALSWFVDAYASLAEWKATVDRLIGFEHALIETKAGRDLQIERRTATAGTAISMEGLSLGLPDGSTLIRDLSLTFPPGSRTLVSGPSGCGKSTLFRAISGLWPFCRGILTLPEGEQLLFLPQKPYLPIATLAEAATYPDGPESHDEADIRRTIADCGLVQLAEGGLHEVRHWSQQLSPGEQQRLAFARALLLRPRWLFLDEATSNLDEASESALDRLLGERLPQTALVSIAHRPTLGVFHQRRLEFVPGEGGQTFRLTSVENPAPGE